MIIGRKAVDTSDKRAGDASLPFGPELALQEGLWMNADLQLGRKHFPGRNTWRE